MGYLHFNPEDYLGEVSDENLIAELKRRDIHVVREFNGDVYNAYSELMRRRLRHARSAIDTLIAKLLPHALVEAQQAIREGKRDDAICALDRLIKPSPAATATEIPLDLRRASH